VLTQVEMQFGPRWHGKGMVNTCLDAFFVIAVMLGDGKHMLRCMLSPRWHSRGLVNTSWDTFCALDAMGGVWSTHVEMHFVSSHACDGFGQHMLRCILCPSWQRSYFSQYMLRYILCYSWHGRGLC
jgi:hypothetical protein